MRLPLRLQLKPSRSYRVFLASGHILAGVAVCLLPAPGLLRTGLVILLGLLLLRLWHRASQCLPVLLLRSDGKLEWIIAGDAVILAEVGGDTVIWPWLVVLHLRMETGVWQALPLFSDSFADPDTHRQLRVWLRWRAEMPTR